MQVEELLLGKRDADDLPHSRPQVAGIRYIKGLVRTESHATRQLQAGYHCLDAAIGVES